MKGLILAGGAGTRLRPITYTSAKQLVPVANTPILFYGLQSMVDAGIRDIGIIVGDTADEVRAAVGDGSRWGATITYIPQDEPLGLAHCVLIAQPFLGADEFVMYLGDNLLEQDLSTFVRAFRDDPSRPAAQILLKSVTDPHRFGVAELDSQGDVVRLVEKPSEPASDLALVGVYLFGPLIHEAVRSIQPSPRGELEITDAIQWLVEHHYRVRTHQLEGWWIDTGKLTPLLEANRLLLERIESRVEGHVDAESTIDGRVVLEPGASVVRSRIRGPVTIASGTRIVDSYIGPYTAIGIDCTVVHSEVEHSVLLERVSITDVPRLQDSLIGRDAVVTRTQSRPKALRLMVGDHCQIDVE